MVARDGIVYERDVLDGVTDKIFCERAGCFDALKTKISMSGWRFSCNSSRLISVIEKSKFLFRGWKEKSDVCKYCFCEFVSNGSKVLRGNVRRRDSSGLK